MITQGTVLNSYGFEDIFDKFLQQFTSFNEFGFKTGSEAIKDVDHYPASVDSTLGGDMQSSWPVQTLVESVMETVEWDDHDEAEIYIIAIVDATDENGFLTISLTDVAQQYSDILGISLDVSKLEHWRRHIQVHGPVLGLASRDVREFRSCVANHIVKGDYQRTSGLQNKYLTIFNKHLSKLITETGLNVGALLRRLAHRVAARETHVRTMTAGVVKKLMRCNKQQSQLLADIYEQLPKTPLLN